MSTHTTTYTVTGTGRAVLDTLAEFDDLKAKLLADASRFTITLEDQAGLVLEYNIHIAV